MARGRPPHRSYLTSDEYYAQAVALGMMAPGGKKESREKYDIQVFLFIGTLIHRIKQLER